MTVQDIKDYITQKINYYKGENYYHTLPTNTVLLDFEQIGIMLDQLDTEWVSVNDEQKPKHRERVLVTDEDEVVFDCLYAEDLYEVGENDTGENDFADYKGRSGFYYYEKAIGSFLEVENIVAWKPLPKPYEKSDENEQY